MPAEIAKRRLVQLIYMMFVERGMAVIPTFSPETIAAMPIRLISIGASEDVSDPDEKKSPPIPLPGEAP